jgi:Icc protein
LNETISRTNLDIIVFIHHPILDCGNSVMDIKYPLLGRTNIIRMLVESGKRVHIFCGHYHTDFTTVFKNIIQYVTPSTLYQLKMHSEKLEIESERIGYRIININGTVIETEVKYLK